MTAFTNPVLLHPDQSSTQLAPISLSQGGADTYNELWLQKALFENPGSLPIQEIDRNAGKLIPICMELPTDAGPADVLYVTLTGQIILVETKLWRNPEARRKVVSQVLDYAKELAGWSYDDLARQVGMATKKGADYLFGCVKRAYPEAVEASFFDGITQTLKTGDFILIIAGDGIQSGAQSLVSFVQTYGHLRFQLALVEVAAYVMPSRDILLQPRILAKTELLTRTVLITKGSGQVIEVDEAREEVPLDEEKLIKNQQLSTWFQSFWTEFVAALRLDDKTQPVPVTSKTTNFFLYVPPGQSQSWISVYLAKGQNEGGVYLTFSKSVAGVSDIYDALYSDKAEIDKLVPGLKWDRNADGKVWIVAPTITLGDLEQLENRGRVRAYLAEQTNLMVNAFRHRLVKFEKERAM